MTDYLTRPSYAGVPLLTTEDAVEVTNLDRPDYDRRFDWQDVAGENKPLYIGVADPGTAESVASWFIQKFTFITGPAGGAVPQLVQTRVGAWTTRAGLFT